MDFPILTVNQTIRYKTDQETFRVLWISDDRRTAYWISLTSGKNVCCSFDVTKIETGIREGTYELTADIWHPAVPEEHIPAKWILRRDRLWDLIHEAVLQEPEIYDRSGRTRILDQLSSSSGKHKNNLYSLIGRYWKGGKVPNALLPAYGNVGQSRDLYKENAKRSGRPKKEGALGKKLNRDDLIHFSEGVRKHYLTPDKNTFKQSYKNMILEWYSVKKEVSLFCSRRIRCLHLPNTETGSIRTGTFFRNVRNAKVKPPFP